MMVASDLSLCVLGWLFVLFASLISVFSSCQVLCASFAWLMRVCCAMMKSDFCVSLGGLLVAWLVVLFVLWVVAWWSCWFCALSVTLSGVCEFVLFVLCVLSGWLWWVFGSDTVG